MKKRIGPAINAHLLRSGFYVVLLLAGILLVFVRLEAPARVSHRTLTFAERVVYQRAVESVYWRHRIWPTERPHPKPSLETVMSQAQLEKKVADYLRNSQALEDYWQRPIKAEQLQAEMDRMARYTKQPEVLRELFAALGNDPFVIAECLARPVLAERLLTSWYAYDQRIHGELKQDAEAELQTHPTVEQMKQLSGKYSEIELLKSDSAGPEATPSAERGTKLNNREWNETMQKLATMFTGCDSKLQTSRGATAGVVPAKGALITQVKTGVVSSLQEDERRFYGTAVIEKAADRLKLATVSWFKEPLESWIARAESKVPTSMARAPANYVLPKISEGGCVDDTWTATQAPPDPRSGHTAVWTGTEMIVWGGADLNSGGKYNPSIDNWTATSTINAPQGRSGHTAIWTGGEMIVWGGLAGYYQVLNTGGRYNPSTDSWIATNTANAPSARGEHTAVWTGDEMIVWGGLYYNGFTPYYLSTGGRYNPSTDSWTQTSTSNAPTSRYFHSAVWTGSEMIVWGGANETTFFNTGGRYNPSSDSWTPTSTTNVPASRYLHSAVWTGSEIIVWGGYNNGDLNTGGRYNPATDSWIPTSTSNAPTSRYFHSAVWTGSEMIVWGGSSGSSPYPDVNTGGKYDPGTDSWTATSTTNAPEARESHTAVWTGSEMIVWGGVASFSLVNTGGRYDPSGDSWTNTGPANLPSPRSGHTAVWTGSEMIVWGGFADFGNTGGRYNPITDSWAVTSTTNAPSARQFHTGVWTGSEMIVWGGSNGSSYFNTGGRYNPITDSWIATNTANAPSARDAHTAVWTGDEMIVWGGETETTAFNTGGRYNPSTDSWITTNTANAPSARARHTAVWTGDEMIVWGGDNDNTGGRYNPATNNWTDTCILEAPDARSGHTAVWTGSEMIVWGGSVVYNGTFFLFNDGGRYNPGTNNWTATSTTNAPSPREVHTAVWTGNEMIIWGGIGQLNELNTGGRYSPGTDSWTATSTTNAPSPRFDHTAVWTGNEMIVWGGEIFNTGGRYCAQFSPPPTPTPSPTPTPCTGRCTPTPRPRPTPHPRPACSP
jgi:N-acetylneuraminic acid mutarotase